jgi:dynein heavy chain
VRKKKLRCGRVGRQHAFILAVRQRDTISLHFLIYPSPPSPAPPPLPGSAVRFHYVFTLRELSAVVGGLLRMTPGAFGAHPLKAARLWAHECERVYADRLVTDADVATFSALRAAVVKKHLAALGVVSVMFGVRLLLSSLPRRILFPFCMRTTPFLKSWRHTPRPQAAIEARPLLFCSFAGGDGGDGGGGGGAYDEVPSDDALRRALEDKLAEHNEAGPAMELVLFRQAAEHVARVSRVLGLPGGHAVLVGVGGSGKQSLARLAAHCAGCEVFQVQVTAGYGVAEFRAVSWGGGCARAPAGSAGRRQGAGCTPG